MGFWKRLFGKTDQDETSDVFTYQIAQQHLQPGFLLNQQAFSAQQQMNQTYNQQLSNLSGAGLQAASQALGGLTSGWTTTTANTTSSVWPQSYPYYNQQSAPSPVRLYKSMDPNEGYVDIDYKTVTDLFARLALMEHKLEHGADHDCEICQKNRTITSIKTLTDLVG